MKFDYLEKQQERDIDRDDYYSYSGESLYTPEARIIAQVNKLKENLKCEQSHKRVKKLKNRLNKIVTERPELFI